MCPWPFRNAAVASLLALLLVLRPGTAEADLKLDLTPARSSWLAGQPVEILAKVTNVGQEPVTEVILLDPRFGEIDLVVAAEGGPWRAYLGPDWGVIDAELRPVTIAPGGSVEARFTVLWNQPSAGALHQLEGHLAFPEPGRYRLLATHPLGVGGLSSGPVGIAIGAPAEGDGELWQFLKETPEVARFIQNPRSGLAGPLAARMAELLARHPRSAYAPLWQAALSASRAQ